MTAADDVLRRFAARSERAAARLSAWQADSRKAEVRPFVMAHVTSTLYSLDIAEIERVARLTDHALEGVDQRGIGIKKSDAIRIQQVQDWHPDFAFTHVLHAQLEQGRGLFTFQEFRTACGTPGANARRMLGDPAWLLHGGLVGAHGDVPTRNALRWRIGNAYYSFLRELYAIAALRDAGLDVRYHPLADVLFRVDGWVGETNINLFVLNRRFRGADQGGARSQGRKVPSSDILRDARPPFRDLSIPLDTRHEYGCVHLPDRDLILRVAREAALL